MSTLRQDIRDDLLGLFVGDRTLGDSLVPPIVFVTVNAFTSIGPASIAALGAGVLVAAFRVRKGQEMMYAFGGIIAVGFAVFLANRSGRAETFFLPGIVSGLFWAVVAFGSVLAKRPLTAFASRFYRQWPIEWFWRDDVRPAYSNVTMLWGVYFGARGAAQGVLFLNEQPELLAVVKVATSWPLIIPLLIASYVYGNRKLHALGGPNTDEFLAEAEPPFAGGQRGF